MLNSDGQRHKRSIHGYNAAMHAYLSSPRVQRHVQQLVGWLQQSSSGCMPPLTAVCAAAAKMPNEYHGFFDQRSEPSPYTRSSCFCKDHFCHQQNGREWNRAWSPSNIARATLQHGLGIERPVPCFCAAKLSAKASMLKGRRCVPARGKREGAPILRAKQCTVVRDLSVCHACSPCALRSLINAKQPHHHRHTRAQTPYSSAIPSLLPPWVVMTLMPCLALHFSPG